MRWQLNKGFAVMACWGLVAGPSGADPRDDVLLAVGECLKMVRAPASFHDVAATGKTKSQRRVGSSTITLQSEVRDGVGVHICASGPMTVQTTLDEAAIRRMADSADMLELNFKAPGLHFADCHNAPNATFGLSIIPDGNALSVLAVQSPAVGAVCAHSYGMQ